MNSSIKTIVGFICYFSLSIVNAADLVCEWNNTQMKNNPKEFVEKMRGSECQKNPEYHSKLGYAYLENGDYARARDSFVKATELNARYGVDLASFYFKVYIDSGNREALKTSIDLYRKLHELYPEQAKILFNLGLAYYMTQDMKRAEEALLSSYDLVKKTETLKYLIYVYESAHCYKCVISFEQEINESLRVLLEDMSIGVILLKSNIKMKRFEKASDLNKILLEKFPEIITDEYYKKLIQTLNSQTTANQQQTSHPVRRDKSAEDWR